MKFLFVCTANLDRSPCAEILFEGSKSCGIHPFAETLISKEALKLADTIFCMEHEHKQHIIDNFPEININKIIVLNIPNIYARYDPELEKLLRIKLKEYLE